MPLNHTHTYEKKNSFCADDLLMTIYDVTRPLSATLLHTNEKFELRHELLDFSSVAICPCISLFFSKVQLLISSCSSVEEYVVGFYEG